MYYQLREYYISYLLNVRKVSQSSVNHYLDALSWISRYLAEKELIKDSVFEVRSIENLEELKNILISDEKFTSMDKRGHQMYTAGLNNYLRFAQGEEFEKIGNSAALLDKPMQVPDQLNESTDSGWRRSEIIKNQTIKIANYQCEIDSHHMTFIANRNGMPYMEAHHTIPMKCQGSFNTSLDVYANIVCICPVCHRFLHFGRKEDKLPVIDRIYYRRSERMAHSGIVLSHNEFLDLVI